MVAQVVRAGFLYSQGRGFKSHPHNKNGVIAQLVEQRTENPRVAGSIPADTTKGNRGVVEQLTGRAVTQGYTLRKG